MLTKDLIKTKTQKDKIIPSFINPENEDLISLSSQLIECFSKINQQNIKETNEPITLGITKNQLENKIKDITSSNSITPLITKGLIKLLFERCTLEEQNPDIINFREKIFTQSSQILKNSHKEETSKLNNSNNQIHDQTITNLRDKFREYQNNVTQNLNITTKKLRTKLYSDLPEFQKIIEFKQISPVKLLNKYNISIIQWLLLHSKEIQLNMPNPSLEDLRFIMKNIRFNQLLAIIKKTDSSNKNNSSDYIITLSGPLNIFTQTKKYGLNLARFFPSILHLPDWEFTSKIHLKRKGIKTIHLDSEGIKISKNKYIKLQPLYKHFLSYIPEEIKIFKELFNKPSETTTPNKKNKIKNTSIFSDNETYTPDHLSENNWEIKEANNFIQFSGEGSETYCFPDFVFINKKNKNEIALEIFHNWHSNIIIKRINQLDHEFKNNSNLKNKLILAVSSKLYKDSKIKKTILASKYFSDYSVKFSSMPNKKQIIEALNKIQ